MMKLLRSVVIVLVFLLIVPPLFYMFNYSQTSHISEKRIAYDLPYPGLLPTNPLYRIKSVRDGMMEFMTRDNVRKAELHLLMADKHLRSAQLLSSYRSYPYVAPALLRSQQYFAKSIKDAIAAKQQGSAAPDEFIQKMKRSDQKHDEVLKQIKSSVPSSDLDTYDQAVRLHKQNHTDLGQL